MLCLLPTSHADRLCITLMNLARFCSTLRLINHRLCFASLPTRCWTSMLGHACSQLLSLRLTMAAHPWLPILPLNVRSLMSLLYYFFHAASNPFSVHCVRVCVCMYVRGIVYVCLLVFCVSCLHVRMPASRLHFYFTLCSERARHQLAASGSISM